MKQIGLYAIYLGLKLEELSDENILQISRSLKKKNKFDKCIHYGDENYS